MNGELRVASPIVVGELNGKLAYIITKSYEVLTNKPQINGVELIGDKSLEDLGIDQTFIYEQERASNSWTIQHNLNKFPSVVIVDTAGSAVVGDVQYIDENTINVSFNGVFSGTAYLN